MSAPRLPSVRSITDSSISLNIWPPITDVVRSTNRAGQRLRPPGCWRWEHSTFAAELMVSFEAEVVATVSESACCLADCQVAPAAEWLRCYVDRHCRPRWSSDDLESPDDRCAA